MSPPPRRFDEVIQAWHLAEVVPVFSAGNSGPNCGTVRSPGDNEEVIAVGATVVDDTIASFSSVGPARDHEGHKPEVSAPGANVRSAYYTSDDAYATMSGTSMACPHVSGLVALLHSHRSLKFADFKEIIQSTASTDNLGQNKVCEGVPDNEYPNFHFGHGRIDCLNAVVEMKKYFP